MEISPPPLSALSQRMDRGDVFARDCPSRPVLQQITGGWGPLVLVALRPGTLRFSQLRRRVNGISERMLAQTLHRLEDYRLVARRSLPVVPPHVEYSLTPLGHEAAARVDGLIDWIETHLGAMLAAPEDASLG